MLVILSEAKDLALVILSEAKDLALVILSEAKDLAVPAKILRFAQDDNARSG